MGILAKHSSESVLKREEDIELFIKNFKYTKCLRSDGFVVYKTPPKFIDSVMEEARVVVKDLGLNLVVSKTGDNTYAVK